MHDAPRQDSGSMQMPRENGDSLWASACCLTYHAPESGMYLEALMPNDASLADLAHKGGNLRVSKCASEANGGRVGRCPMALLGLGDHPIPRCKVMASQAMASGA